MLSTLVGTTSLWQKFLETSHESTSAKGFIIFWPMNSRTFEILISLAYSQCRLTYNYELHQPLLLWPDTEEGDSHSRKNPAGVFPSRMATVTFPTVTSVTVTWRFSSIELRYLRRSANLPCFRLPTDDVGETATGLPSPLGDVIDRYGSVVGVFGSEADVGDAAQGDGRLPAIGELASRQLPKYCWRCTCRRWLLSFWWSRKNRVFGFLRIFRSCSRLDTMG